MKIPPLVSICCITYNHVNYIRDAIEGFLMQETSFPFEIIIHDDASTDGTSEIIQEYANKYPELFVTLLQKENQWSKGDGSIYARFVYPRAQGKYIALCEGDDYWTDPLKLQKQVDFLEANPEYSGCSHQSIVTYNDGKRKDHFFRKNVDRTLSINQLIDTRLFHTASFIFKSSIIQRFELPKNITAGDRALFILIAANGSIKYIDEAMCVYRKESMGISSWVTVEMMKKDLNIIPWIKEIYPKFPTKKYKCFIYKTILTYPNTLNLVNIIKYYLLFIVTSFSFFPNNLKLIISFTIKVLPKILLKNLNQIYK